MKYNEILEIDDTDKEIIELLQKNPDITHSEIAEKVHKSQPAVGARIIKLKRKHLLTTRIGAEFDKLSIKLARIEIAAKNVSDIWEKFGKCPHIINCFKMTGDYNLMIEIVAPNVKSIDRFVDECLREDPSIIAIRSNFVIDTLRTYVIPLSFDVERLEEFGCSYECGGPLNKKDLEKLLNK
jgi:Lrp/AsnC family leucine-responsive transcriptional regulator